MKLTPSSILGIESLSLLLLIVGFLAGSVGWRASPSDPAPARPSPPAPPPRKVGDPDRVRQVLRPGKTYQTRTTGALHVRGQDKDWGLSTVVTINYARLRRTSIATSRAMTASRSLNSGTSAIFARSRSTHGSRTCGSTSVRPETLLNLGLGALPSAFPEAGIPAAGFVKALDGVSAEKD